MVISNYCILAVFTHYHDDNYVLCFYILGSSKMCLNEFAPELKNEYINLVEILMNIGRDERDLDLFDAFSE